MSAGPAGPLLVTALLALALPGGAGRASGSEAAGDTARWTEAGRLVRPENYRRWVFVGAPLTPDDLNHGRAAFPEFHTVYMNPSAFDAYRRTGAFPNGTLLVLERVSVGTRQAASGYGYFMGEFLGLEVAVKDRARFPAEPGGWAYFSFGTEPGTQARAAPTAECAACHQAEAAEDLVFTQYYPVLRAARPADPAPEAPRREPGSTADAPQAQQGPFE